PSLPLLFLVLLRRPPLPPLFPYTTLFRSNSPASTSSETPDRAGTSVSPCRKTFRRSRTTTIDIAGGVPHANGPVKPNPWVPNVSDRKSTRLNSSHVSISYAVFCLKKKKKH